MIVNACKWRKALPEDFDPKTGRYNEEDTTGRPQGETQRGENTTGKWCKMRNVTFMVCKLEKVAFVTYWNCKIMHICWILWYFLKSNFYPYFLSTTNLKTFTGSFSRYWNEIEKFFFQNMFCQNMFKKLISILKLCPKSGLKHSVDHAQVIGMKFKICFFRFFFGRNLVQKWHFYQKYVVSNLKPYIR